MSRKMFGLALLAALAVASSPAVPNVLGEEPTVRYQVVDLGANPISQPAGLSNAGHVVGDHFVDSERVPFLWEDGSLSDLDGVDAAFAVNNAGVVVGYATNAKGNQSAVRWKAGVVTDLGALKGGKVSSAHDVNSLGWIVGTAEGRKGKTSFDHAALWRDGKVLDLGTFGGEVSRAFAVSNAGHVVGQAWYPLPQRLKHAFLWSDATGMIDLGTLGGGDSVARDVNDFGEVVGNSKLEDGSMTHAFLWTEETGMLDLGAPPEASDSRAEAINDAGQIVGGALFFTEEPPHFRFEPLLWEDGTMYMLNDLIDPASGWTLIQAHDINDMGAIAVTARQGSDSYRAALLEPVLP